MVQCSETRAELAGIGMRAVLVNDEESWNEMYSRMVMADFISFDTETSCLDPLAHIFEMVGLSIALDAVTGYYVPLNHRKPRQPFLIDPTTGEPPEEIIQLPEKWVLDRLRPLLETRPIIGHGLKFDWQVMKMYGIELRNIFYDTLPASHIVDEREWHGLKFVTEKHLGYKSLSFEDITGQSNAKGKGRPGKKKKGRRTPSNFETVPLMTAVCYAAPDAVNPVRLMRHFEATYEANSQFKRLLHDVEIPLIPVVAAMEMVGSDLDTEHLVAMHNDLTVRIKAETDELRRLTKDPRLNPASTKQMVELLYKKVGLRFPGKKKKDKSDKGMLTADTIDRIKVNVRSDRTANYRRWSKQEVLGILKAYSTRSKLTKLDSTYTVSLIDQISDDGKLHTSLLQNSPRSGRFASSEPNLQNIPRATDPSDPAYGYDVRRALRADPGYVYVLSDYQGMEVRITAAVSGCVNLTAIVTGGRRDARGNRIDVHLWTACAAFGLSYDEVKPILDDADHPRYRNIKEKRQKAKPVIFGIIYGQTEFGLAAELNETREAARAIISAFMRAYPGVAKWMREVEVSLRSKLYTETRMGRRRRISRAETYNKWAFAEANRQCRNHIVQGIGADIVKQAMLKVDQGLKRLGGKAKMLLQIHDEIIVHCPESEYEAVAKMMVEEMYYELDGIPLPAEAEVKRTLSKMEKPLWKYVAPAA